MRQQTAIAICTAACMTFVFVSHAQEKKVTKKEVPAAVISAFEKAYPKAKIKGYAQEVEEGKTYYEIESMNEKMTLDVLYRADGTHVESEEGLPPEALPAPVKDAVIAKHPGAKITKSEKTTRGEVITYELGLTVGKEKMSMAIDPKGKVVKESKVGAKKEKAEKEEKEEKED